MAAAARSLSTLVASTAAANAARAVAVTAPSRYAGFWTLILDQPRPSPASVSSPIKSISTAHSATTARTPITVPTWTATSADSKPPITPSSTPSDASKENAAARLIAPDGIVPFPVPPPPHNPPEAPTDCCMSGCLHCVWNHYLDDVVAYQRTVRDWHAQRYDWARDQLMRTLEGTPQAAWWQRERDDAEIKMREPDSEEAERRAALSVMDPAMRVFWEMEQKANRVE